MTAKGVLRDLVNGKRSDVPAEGIPGVPIIYQSGAKRTHEAQTKGPTVITPEREVLVDCELEAGGIVIERVRFGYGPRTWRFASQADPLPKRKQKVEPKAAPPRYFLGNPSDMRQRYAET